MVHRVSNGRIDHRTNQSPEIFEEMIAESARKLSEDACYMVSSRADERLDEEAALDAEYDRPVTIVSRPGYPAVLALVGGEEEAEEILNAKSPIKALSTIPYFLRKVKKLERKLGKPLIRVHTSR